MRVSRGHLIAAAACCASLAAMPASIAEATSTGAALSTGARPQAELSFGARSPHTAHSAHTAHTARATHTARAAGDPAVTVADFHFAPAATTIHVGDTITWTNNGPSSHTATARDGSFDTGVLKKGQSASHTFTHPGTFRYVCQIHPFMHGTIVVLAATRSAGGSSTTGASTTTAASTTAASTTAASTTAAASTTRTATAAAAPADPTLPNTGFDVLAGLSAGLLLLVVGAGLRRAHPR